jgi:hypothetical protein
VPDAVWALLLYITLTLVHYRDVLAAPTQRLLGNGDAFNYLWRTWWWAGGYKQWGGDVWFAPQLMYPHGHYIAEAELTPLQLLPAALFAKLAGPLAGYTTIGIVSMVFAGFVTYLYARSLKTSAWGSALAGVIFMTAPYMTLHWVGHVPLMGAWTLPAGLLAIEKLAEAVASREQSRARWATVGLGVSLGLSAWSSWYYFVMFGIAFAVYALVRLSPTHTCRPERPWAHFGVALVIAAIMVAPVYAMVKTHSAQQMSWPVSRVWGAPPFAYLVPGTLHPVFGPASAKILGHSPGEDSLYLGVVGLVLAIVGIVVWRRRSASVAPLVWTAAVAYVLSLGPRLYLGQFGGWAKLPFEVPHIKLLRWDLHKVFDMGVPMPEIVLAVAPITNGIRQPDRFGVVVLVAVAALAALGFDAVARKLRGGADSPGRRAELTTWALWLVLLGVVLFEFATVSIWSPTDPRPVEKWLANQKGAGSVIWLPNYQIAEDEQIYKTTVTGKPIAFGSSTFVPREVQLMRQTLPRFPSTQTVAQLDKARVRWVVWQKYVKPEPNVSGTYTKVAEFDDVVVFERVGFR